MIVWLREALVLAIHERQLAVYGGSSGLRDSHLLSAALAWPRQRHAYGDPSPDIADLAATLAFGIAAEKPFVSGNVRTAHVAYRTFLELNAAILSGTAQQKIDAIKALSDGRWSPDHFAEWLRPRLYTTAGSAVHEPRPAYGPTADKRRDG
jgi:death-on-curing protein